MPTPRTSILGAAKRDVVAGLQFAFDLPYKGYFNVAPLVTGRSGTTTPSLMRPRLQGPGAACLGRQHLFKPTWAIETNYYMDLGFLPQNMQ